MIHSTALLMCWIQLKGVLTLIFRPQFQNRNSVNIGCLFEFLVHYYFLNEWIVRFLSGARYGRYLVIENAKVRKNGGGEKNEEM